MELNSNIVELLNLIEKEPVFMVFGTAFGIPLFMFVFAMTIGRIYKKAYFASALNTIIFTTLGLTWLFGFVLMIILFIIGISGIKLFTILLLLLLFLFVFILLNFTSVNKFIDEQSEGLKQKSNR